MKVIRRPIVKKNAWLILQKLEFLNPIWPQNISLNFAL